MSVHVASWAWRQKVGDAGAKLVLVKLAEQANDRGECWPSQKRLADECEMSRRTVQRKLELLYQAGLVAAEPRARDDGGDSSLFYRLGPVQAAEAPPVRQSDAPPHVTGDAPPTSTVTHHEPSSEPTSPSEDGEGDARQRAPRPRDDIWDILEERFGHVEPKTQAHGKRNKATADLRRHDATPDSIRHALDAWPRIFPGATVTDVALATHYPQLTAGYQHRPPLPPEHVDDLTTARARLRSHAAEIPQTLARAVCPECEIGGGRHAAGCGSARETTSQAYRRFVAEAAADPGYPIDDIHHLIDDWRDLDDVARHDLHDLADHTRGNATPTATEEAAA